MSTRTGMGFRCGGALGRGAWARVASSGCQRWPAEREMGVYVGRPKFGVKLSSLPVLKATLGTGKGGFGSRVDSHWHGVSVWRSLGPWGLGTRGVRGPPAVSVGHQLFDPWASGCLRWPAEREMGIYVGRPKFGVKLSSLPVLKATLGTGKGGFGSRVDSHWHGVSVWRSLGPWGLGTRGVLRLSTLAG